MVDKTAGQVEVQKANATKTKVLRSMKSKSFKNLTKTVIINVRSKMLYVKQKNGRDYYG